MSAPVTTVSLTEHPQPLPQPAAPPAAVQLDLEGALRGRVMQVGEYVVGEAPDPRLTGHPSIRY